MNDQPYLSVVVASRNDDHGGGLLERMQLFTTTLLEQARTFNLPGELILVEWNPPDERPRLSQALNWRLASERFRVRIIEVPAEIHRRFKHSDVLPFFQMIAKNVGIRRARGRFILATSIDLLFANELMQYLAAQSLERGRLYRTDRYDVPASVPNDIVVQARLDYCRSHVIRLFLRNGTFIFREFHSPDPFLLRLGASQGSIARLLCRLVSRLGIGGVQRPSNAPRPPSAHLKRLRNLAAFAGNARGKTRPPILHLNACGDFTLMSREDWFALRGHPELEMYSLRIDALSCLMAYFDGLREHVLSDPMCIYHIDHGEGWTGDHKSDQDLIQQLDRRQVPILTLEAINKYVVQMEQRRRSIVFNDEAWGLAAESLRETTICSPG